jgi:hypothetical protein
VEGKYALLNLRVSEVDINCNVLLLSFVKLLHLPDGLMYLAERIEAAHTLYSEGNFGINIVKLCPSGL